MKPAVIDTPAPKCSGPDRALEHGGPPKLGAHFAHVGVWRSHPVRRFCSFLNQCCFCRCFRRQGGFLSGIRRNINRTQPARPRAAKSPAPVALPLSIHSKPAAINAPSIGPTI